MTVTTTGQPTAATQPAAGTTTTSPAIVRRPGRWIENWDPESTGQWTGGGRRIARRNLWLSVFSEHIGFSIWSLWSVFVLFLTPKYGISKVATDAAAQKFLLTTMPTALGAGVRIPYTLAVTRFGGRNWTIVSALALLVPALSAAIWLKPGVSFTALLVMAALAGVGGGNFASSMTNINAFFPQRLKGAALGVNAGGGNVGVATVQLVALAVLATAGKGHPRLILAVYIPLIVLAGLAASLFMDNLAHVRAERHALRDVCRSPHTLVVSLLYIGTFGSFIGFGFAFGQVLTIQFGSHFSTISRDTHLAAVDPVKVASLTFLGPLIGSLARPVGGWLADRLGGALTTLINFVAMALTTGLILFASAQRSLPLFLLGFVLLFVLSGVGNGSTYKMIPAIFARQARRRIADGVSAEVAQHDARRLTGALIGVAGAIGAFGGVGVNIALRQSFLTYHDANAAYLVFIGFYLLCAVLTSTVYLRRGRWGQWGRI